MRFWFRVLGIPALIFLAISSTGWLIYACNARAELNDRLAKLEAIGWTKPIEDLMDPSWTKENDAWPALQEAQAWLEESLPTVGEEQLLGLGDPKFWTESERNLSRQYLDLLAPYFDMLHEAATKTHAWGFLDWMLAESHRLRSQGSDVSTWSVSLSSALSRPSDLLSQRISLDTLDPDRQDRVAASLHDWIDLQEVTAMGPMSNLVSYWNQFDTLVRTLQLVLHEQHIDPRPIRNVVDPFLQRVTTIEKFLTGCRFEVPFVLSARKTALEGLGVFGFLQEPAHDRAITQVLDRAMATRERLIRWNREPLPTIGEMNADVSSEDLLGRIYSGMCVEAQLARLALAVYEFRADKGTWPSSLNELERYFPDGIPTRPVPLDSLVYEPYEGGMWLRYIDANAPEDDEPLDEWQEERRARAGILYEESPDTWIFLKTGTNAR